MNPGILTPTGTATADLLQLELSEYSAPARTPSAPSHARATTTRSQQVLDQQATFDGRHASHRQAGEPGFTGQTHSLSLRHVTPDQGTPRLASSSTALSRPTVAADPTDPLAVAGQAGRLPGSTGEHLLQCAYGTQDRAQRFYDNQVLDRLNSEMTAFIGRMELAFVATADSKGECDSTLRAGPPGFIRVLDERQVAYPEYRGNGVMASLGNISENPHIGILMIDFVTDLIGLHVNGKARIVEDADLRIEHPKLSDDFERGRTPERWVVVEVEEAYVPCRKHIPRMVPVARTREWGTDDIKRKGGDYFGATAESKPWNQKQRQPVGAGESPRADRRPAAPLGPIEDFGSKAVDGVQVIVDNPATPVDKEDAHVGGSMWFAYEK